MPFFASIRAAPVSKRRDWLPAAASETEAFDCKRMSTRPPPDCDIAKIETGQWMPGGDRLRGEEIAVGEPI